MNSIFVWLVHIPANIGQDHCNDEQQQLVVEQRYFLSNNSGFHNTFFIQTKTTTRFSPMAALDLFKTNKKATGGCAVASIYEKTSRNLPGSRRTPRINSPTTAETSGADEFNFVCIVLNHRMRLLS